jgi:hypothetical protein
MDASSLGSKEKVDGKNQRTVLSEDEIAYIINTFISGTVISVCKRLDLFEKSING